MLEALQKQEAKIKGSLNDAEARLATAKKCKMEETALNALQSRIDYIQKELNEMVVRICQVQTTIESAQAHRARAAFQHDYKSLTGTLRINQPNIEYWRKHSSRVIHHAPPKTLSMQHQHRSRTLNREAEERYKHAAKK